MSDYQRPIRPIITGTPNLPQQQKRSVQQANPNAFCDLLRARIDEQTPQAGAVTFSKHAKARAEQRGISLSESDIERLGVAMEKAGDKGIKDTLVFMNSTAFIVNVPSRVVVTMVDQNDDTTVFSNIDGAVIL